MDSAAQRIEATLARLAPIDVAPEHPAGRLGAAWEGIWNALSPVIGQEGCAALLRRSLHLAIRSHGLLMPAYEGLHGRELLEALKVVLESPPRAEVALANRALMQTFHGLLAGLVGASLTERLLAAVRDPLSPGVSREESAR